MRDGLQGVIDRHDAPWRVVTAGAKGCVSFLPHPIRNFRDFRELDGRYGHAHWLVQHNRGAFLPPWGKVEQWLISVQHTDADVDRFVANTEHLADRLLWALCLMAVAFGLQRLLKQSGEPRPRRPCSSAPAADRAGHAGVGSEPRARTFQATAGCSNGASGSSPRHRSFSARRDGRPRARRRRRRAGRPRRGTAPTTRRTTRSAACTVSAEDVMSLQPGLLGVRRELALLGARQVGLARRRGVDVAARRTRTATAASRPRRGPRRRPRRRRPAWSPGPCRASRPPGRS